MASVNRSHVPVELTTINLESNEKWIAQYAQKVIGVMVLMVPGYLLLVTLTIEVQ